LETSAGAGLTVFFTFNHTTVAGQKPVTAKAGGVSFVNLTQGAGKSVTASAGLTVYAAAIHIDENIKFIFTGNHHQRRPHNVYVFALRKVFVQNFSVDSNFSAAFAHINAGDRCFSSTCSNTKIPNHNIPLWIKSIIEPVQHPVNVNTFPVKAA
jgi:hypothetical protein